jgi:hypothetical protein
MLILGTAMLPLGVQASEGLRLDVDFLAAWQQRNDVQVPNDAASTRFALDSITGKGPYAVPRMELSGRFGERQEWRILAAPLSLTEPGELAAPVDFQRQRFAAGPVEAHYQFDSWRATWRYRWIEREDLQVRVGFTAKVRSASIRLRQGALHATRNDTGFVPLLHASFQQSLGDAGSAWRIEGDIDALGGGPGYAVDAGLRLSREISADWRVHAGARFLDGGADNDKVYAFARFTSLGVGLSWRPASRR